MKKFIVGLLLFLIVLVAFGSFFFYSQSKYMVGRASISQASFSIDNSYVFVTPLRAKADGKDKVRITVFVLNNQGIGVSNKKISLENTGVSLITPLQSITDSLGKAIFDVASVNQGEFIIDVGVEGSILPQKAHITFY